MRASNKTWPFSIILSAHRGFAYLYINSRVDLRVLFSQSVQAPKPFLAPDSA